LNELPQTQHSTKAATERRSIRRWYAARRALAISRHASEQKIKGLLHYVRRRMAEALAKACSWGRTTTTG
jgi:hypothetical protein